MKISAIKKVFSLEFYEDILIAVLKFLIKRNPISPFYAFWKTLFKAKEWKSFKTYFQKFNKDFWTKHPLISAFGSFVFLTLVISSTIYLTFLRNPNQTSAAWWDEGWKYRKVLEIQNEKVAEDLTNFPVLISFTDPDLISKVQADADDIAFTSILGTKLSHEIESYSNTTGALVVWVKLPFLSSSEDTKIHMYYGNSSVSSQQDSENVWDSDYKLVQHLNEDPSGTAPQSIDSTSNSKDGTSYGTMTTADLVDAKIGKGIDFDATDDAIHHGDLGIGNVYTMESWVKADTLSGSGDHATYGFTIAASSYPATTYPLWLTLQGSEVWYRSFEASPTGEVSTSGAGINTTDWFHIVVTAVRGGTSRVYVNGVQELSFTNDADNNWTSGFTIGDLRPDRQIVFDGMIDEVRVSSAERSAGWILTSHNNQDDPTAFFSVGDQQAAPGNPVAHWTFNEGAGTTVNDESGFGNNGTISGATWANKSECVVGTCLEFDGDDDYVEIGDADELDLSGGEYSISTWVRANDFGDNGQGRIIDHGGGASPYEGWALHIDESYYATNGIVMQVNNNSTGRANSNDNVVTIDRWHHIETTFDGSDVRFYLDGKLVGTDSSESPIATTDPIRIGMRASDTQREFSGFIDEVKIYNYARNANQVKQDYNSGTASVKVAKGSSVSFGGGSKKWLTDGLVGYWKMDELAWNGTVNEVVDLSGDENHGVRVGDADTTNGKYGSGGIFDGTGDYVDLGGMSYSASDIQEDGITYSTWFKLGSSLAEGTYSLVGAGSATSNSWFSAGGLKVRKGSSFTYAGFDLYDGAYKNANTPQEDDLQENRWYHVVGVFDPIDSKLKIYLDGALKDEGDVEKTGVTLEPNFSYIGKNLNITNNYYFNGTIDDTRVYKRALGASEVKKLYNEAPTPVLDLKMDEKEGSNVYDSSGYENNATLYNSPTWTRGKYGNGLQFADSTIDYIETPKDSSLNFSKSAGITLESWVYLESNDDAHNIMSGWDGDANLSGSAYWNIDNQNSQNYGIRNMVGGVATDRSVATTWDMNRWYFVSYTYDGAEEILYRDGKVMGSWSQTGNIDYEDEIGVMVGVGRQKTLDFGGKIDGVKIYNYARTKSQIVEDMSAGGISSKSPVLYLSLNENRGGTAYDSSIFNNDGTLNHGSSGGNSSDSDLWDVGGKYGSALSFDGTNDYVQIPDDNSLDITDGITVSVWANPATASGFTATFRTLLSKDSHGSQPYGFYWDSTAEELEFLLNNGSERLTVDYDYSDQIGQWNHLVAWYDKSNIKIYANGQLLGEKAYTATLPTDSAPVRIGWEGDAGSDRYFVGKIDEVKVWDYALSENEIQQEFVTSGRAVQLGGEGRTAASGFITKTGENAKYCVPGDSDSCDAPVLELDFDEKTGTTAYDISGNGNNGTLTGMDVNTDWVRGKYGSALDFDGSNDYVNAGNDSSLDIAGDNITLEVWINPTVSGMGNGWVIWKSSSWWNNEGYGMRIGTSDRLEFYTRINSRVITSSVLQDNKWYHVVGTYDGARANLYLNGVLNATSTYVTPIVTTSANVYVGSNGGEFFSGKIDDVRIYNYTRTPAQIAWDYNKGKPIVHWKFDEGIGLTVHDESGNGNDGTMNNMDENLDWVIGKKGKALSFDGSNDYVETSTSTDIGSDNGSMSLWFKTATTDNRIQFLFGDRSDSAPGEYLQAWLENGRINSRKTTGGASRNLNGTYAVNDGNWHSLILLWGDDGFKMLVDGKVDAETPTTTTGWNASQDVYFGIVEMYPSSSYYYEGELDEVKFFNYTLNDEQIKRELNAGAALKID